MSEKRSYVMKKRAEGQETTRQKIVEAAMHLHEEVGPRETTISAIAERAGVQRLTVYRHFPNEFAVFEACTSHWIELNPPPDATAWAEVSDAMVRAETALSAFYAYFAGTRQMLSRSYRDVEHVPALHGPMAAVKQYNRSIANDLSGAFAAKGTAGERLAATMAHAIHFPTWEHLESLGLNEAQKVEVVLDWIRGSMAAERS